MCWGLSAACVRACHLHPLPGTGCIHSCNHCCPSPSITNLLLLLLLLAGGFLASLDRQGNAIPPTNKTANQQASQLTAFSHLLSASQDPQQAGALSTLNTTELRAAADTAYNFLTTKMIAQVTEPANGACEGGVALCAAPCA